jgi:hypothetical protein
MEAKLGSRAKIWVTADDNTAAAVRNEDENSKEDIHFRLN